MGAAAWKNSPAVILTLSAADGEEPQSFDLAR